MPFGTVRLLAAGASPADVGSGNQTPPLPAGVVVNTFLLLVVTAADNVVITLPSGGASAITGWLKKLETNGSATLRQTIAGHFWKPGDAAPVVTHAAGDAIISRLFGFQGVALVDDPFEAIAAQLNNANATCTAPTITPPSKNAAVVYVGSEELDANTSGAPTWSGYSGTNPTFVEIGDDNNGLGVNMISQGVAWGLDSDGSATGARTAAIAGEAVTPTQNIGTLLALTPARELITPDKPNFIYMRKNR